MGDQYITSDEVAHDNETPWTTLNKRQLEVLESLTHTSVGIADRGEVHAIDWSER